MVKVVSTFEERIPILEKYIKPRKFDLLIISYEGVNLLNQDLKSIRFHTMIVDEAHKLKNDASIIHCNLKKLHC